jgi:hypothetical protein
VVRVALRRLEAELDTARAREILNEIQREASADNEPAPEPASESGINAPADLREGEARKPETP